MNHIESRHRNSQMELDLVYFWTDTIKDHKHLLNPDKYKSVIISSWKELVYRKLIVVYGFVIMPNHLHVIWELNELNGKEMPHASFNKFTSHMIIKDLKKNNPNQAESYRVNESERAYRVWQRDPLAILMDNKEKFEQKLNYIHLNPLQVHWSLAESPENYKWSSSKFYENGIDDFGFLTHYMERF